jgi:hypothetical protein
VRRSRRNGVLGDDACTSEWIVDSYIGLIWRSEQLWRHYYREVGLSETMLRHCLRRLQPGGLHRPPDGERIPQKRSAGVDNRAQKSETRNENSGNGFVSSKSIKFTSLAPTPFPLTPQNAAAPVISLNPPVFTIDVADPHLKLPRTYQACR